jgi:hypothetical protein
VPLRENLPFREEKYQDVFSTVSMYFAVLATPPFLQYTNQYAKFSTMLAQPILRRKPRKRNILCNVCMLGSPTVKVRFLSYRRKDGIPTSEPNVMCDDCAMLRGNSKREMLGEEFECADCHKGFTPKDVVYTVVGKQNTSGALVEKYSRAIYCRDCADRQIRCLGLSPNTLRLDDGNTLCLLDV